MTRLFFYLLLPVALMSACSPALNWRDVRLESAPLVALFPCKPEQATRTALVGTETVTLTVLACDAGDAKFALAYARADKSAGVDTLLTQWRASSLANMGAPSSQVQSFPVRNGQGSVQGARVRARGVRPDGQPVALDGLWFADKSVVYQAAVYSKEPRSSVADVYFEGLRLP